MVAVAIRGHDAERDKAIRGERCGAVAGFDRIGRIIVLDRANLVQSHIAVGSNADREHQLVGRGRAPFDDTAVHAQIDLLASQDIDNARRSSRRAQHIGEIVGHSGTVRTVADDNGTGETLGVIHVERRVIDDQQRFANPSNDGRRIVFDRDRDRTADRRVFAIIDRDRNHKAGALLTARIGVIDRTKQRYRVSAGIVDHDSNNHIGAGRTGQRVTVRADRPGDRNPRRGQCSARRTEDDGQGIAIGVGHRKHPTNDGGIGGVGRTGVVGVGQADRLDAFFRHIDRRSADERRIILFLELANFLEFGGRVE